MTSPLAGLVSVRRLLLLAVVVVVGVPLGAAARLAVTDGTDRPGAAGRDPTVADPGSDLPAAQLTTDTPPVVVVWRPGGLPEDTAALLAEVDGVVASTVVASETLTADGFGDDQGRAGDDPAAGWAIPLDTVAIEPAGYPAFVPRDLAGTIGSLGDDEVLLSTSTAERHSLAPGSSIATAGRRLTVAAVVADTALGGSEAAVTATTGRALGMVTPRYALVEHDGDRGAVERTIAAALPAPLRFRAPGEVAFLREADAVPTQAEVKARFGEFAVRPEAAPVGGGSAPGGGGSATVEQDPAWLDANLVTATVPLLGEVRCHRSVLASLEGAMRQLEEEHLGYLVDPASSSACWAPARIDGSTRISRHAWGIAVDLNAAKNPTGVSSVQGERLVEIMREWGFLWGGDWREPQPSYFEHRGAP